MKTKSAALATGVATLAVAFSLSPALADSPGQLEGGSLVYKVKDVTQNGSYANTISANACDTLKYSVLLHNTEFGALNNVTVKVDLPSASAASNTSTMTATTAAAGTTGTSGVATVNLSSAQSISYLPGTAQLLDKNGNVIKTLPDTITNGGVDVGTLNGSTTEFVNFEAKVNCPTTPPVTPPTTPQPLPQTGVEGAGLAGMAGTGAVGYAVMAYRRSKKALAQTLLNRK